MKTILSILFYALLNSLCQAQVDHSEHWVNSGWEYSNEDDEVIDLTKKVIHNNDLSYLLKSIYPGYNKEKEVMPLYGLLGEHLEKIEFVFTEIKRSEKDVAQYFLKGKTKLKDEINDFEGSIIFEKATAYISDNNDERAEVVLTASYKLIEDSNAKTAGTFIGKMKMVLTAKDIHASPISFNMDMFYEDGAVRGFVGVKETNGSEKSESCIWGFTRFPHEYAKYFDLGDGEEVINIKYGKPWFDYSDQEWNDIISGQDKTVYLHNSNKEKGMHTSNKNYIEPEEASWFQLSPDDLEKVVLEQLNINPNKLDREFFSQKPINPKEIIMIVPEMVVEEEDYFELKTYILIVNNETGKIIHKYLDRPNLSSDAIILSEIEIDTAPYILSENNRAFGMRVWYHGMSQANPYGNTTLYLFMKSGDTLKEVLRAYDVVDYHAEWNMRCAGESVDHRKTLAMSTNKTNEYFDILVKNEITYTESFEDENGDCNATEKITLQKTVLQFNGEAYIENGSFSPLDVYINDPDTKGTNVRQEPSGKIILKLNQDNDYFKLTITEERNGWFKVEKVIGIEGNNVEIPGGSGWIHHSVIGIATRRDIELLDVPESGGVIGTVEQETGVRIKDKYLDWVQIEYNGLLGWVDSKWLCGNPVTTCP